MADRKVTFTLGTAVDPQNQAGGVRTAAALGSIKSAAEGASKAVRNLRGLLPGPWQVPAERPNGRPAAVTRLEPSAALTGVMTGL